MKDKDFALLDDYFNGRLNPAEAQDLLLRANSDTELAMELALREKMERFLRDRPERLALTDNLQTIGADYFPGQEAATPPVLKARVSWTRRLMLAAAVLVVLIAAWFLFAPEPSLYRQYAQYQPLHLSERGNSNALVVEADATFNAKDFPRALDALDRLLAAEPDNGSARLYKGICLLEMNRPADARKVLEPLATGRSALRAEGIWYTALSYLLENDLQGCKGALRQIEPPDPHFKAAQQLLKKI